MSNILDLLKHIKILIGKISQAYKQMSELKRKPTFKTFFSMEGFSKLCDCVSDQLGSEIKVTYSI